MGENYSFLMSLTVADVVRTVGEIPVIALVIWAFGWSLIKLAAGGVGLAGSAIYRFGKGRD